MTAELNTAQTVYFKRCQVEWEQGGGNVPMIQIFSDVASTLRAGAGAPKHMSDIVGRNVMTNKTVRRLTPIECERLQGWPDNYTNVPLNGKPATDSARYKSLGNGMAQPCARWIIQRIVDVTGGETDGDRKGIGSSQGA